jgi:hypothetical protein
MKKKVINIRLSNTCIKFMSNARHNTTQNQIIELKEQVSRLKREIADRDNERTFYKSKTDNSSINSLTKSERSSHELFRESIYINKTASEIPEYSFSVNDRLRLYLLTF